VGFSRDADAVEEGVMEMRPYDTAGGLDLEGLDAVVHLAGESVLGRWTARKRARILESRVEGTRAVVEALKRLKEGPKILVTASAIGYYGNRGDELVSEEASPGKGFLAEVVRAWEEEAQRAEDAGVRVTVLRIGFVLGRGGAASRLLRYAFSNGLGGRLGSGKQWMSWVHVDDVAGLCRYALEEAKVSGVINAVAPHSVRNEDFTEALAEAFKRPAICPVPAWALRATLGEASELLLASMRVEPREALARGYVFAYPGLSSAIEDAVISH
jgi:uncharacterized protein (TIGR01777 family)